MVINNMHCDYTSSQLVTLFIHTFVVKIAERNLVMSSGLTYCHLKTQSGINHFMITNLQAVAD